MMSFHKWADKGWQCHIVHSGSNDAASYALKVAKPVMSFVDELQRLRQFRNFFIFGSKLCVCPVMAAGHSLNPLVEYAFPKGQADLLWPEALPPASNLENRLSLLVNKWLISAIGRVVMLSLFLRFALCLKVGVLENIFVLIFTCVLIFVLFLGQKFPYWAFRYLSMPFRTNGKEQANSNLDKTWREVEKQVVSHLFDTSLSPAAFLHRIDVSQKYIP